MENSLKPVLRHAASLSTLIGDGDKRGEWSMACWLEAATPGRELFICPAQIPFGYARSVVGDRWQAAQAIRQAVDRIWRRQIRDWRYGTTRTR